MFLLKIIYSRWGGGDLHNVLWFTALNISEEQLIWLPDSDLLVVSGILNTGRVPDIG